MKKPIKLFLGIAISLFCFWLAFRNFEFSQLKISLAQAKWSWITPVFFLFILSYLLRTLRWSLLLSPFMTISVMRLFPILSLGFMINNLVPARMGELVRGVLVAKAGNAPVSPCFVTIVLERVSDFLGIFILVILSFRLIPYSISWEKVSGIIILGFILTGALVAIYISLKKRINWSGFAKVDIFINQIMLGFSSLRSVKKVGGVVLLSLIIWSLEAVMVMILSRAFHLDLSLHQAAGLIVGLVLGVMIPAAPGYFGTYELFGQKALTLMNFSPDQALPFLLIMHFFQIAMTLLLGATYLIFYGPFKLDSIKNDPRLAT